MMLASLTNPGGLDIAGFVGALFFLAAGYNQVRKALGKENRQIEPQPLEVKPYAGAANEKDCMARYLANEKDIAELKRQMESDRRESSIHRKAIYDKMESVRKELVGQNEAIREKLSDKIDEMPNRMVTILKNTGAI